MSNFIPNVLLFFIFLNGWCWCIDRSMIADYEGSIFDIVAMHWHFHNQKYLAEIVLKDSQQWLLSSASPIAHLFLSLFSFDAWTKSCLCYCAAHSKMAWLKRRNDLLQICHFLLGILFGFRWRIDSFDGERRAGLANVWLLFESLLCAKCCKNVAMATHFAAL